jgi:hypothetical protein
MFILLAIHLPLAAVVSDGCVYVDEHQGLLNETFTGDKANVAVVINACLLNTSLITALNLTEELNFANQITFPDLPPINQSFDFPALDTFVSQIDALDVCKCSHSFSSLSPAYASIANEFMYNSNFWLYLQLECRFSTYQ